MCDVYLQFGVTIVIPQSLQFQAQVNLASLRLCHNSWQCVKFCARRSVFFCSQNGGGASIVCWLSSWNHYSDTGGPHNSL